MRFLIVYSRGFRTARNLAHSCKSLFQMLKTIIVFTVAVWIFLCLVIGTTVFSVKSTSVKSGTHDVTITTLSATSHTTLRAIKISLLYYCAIILLRKSCRKVWYTLIVVFFGEALILKVETVGYLEE